jgi:putative spermidine/putrescine transport system permease protein
MSFVHKTGSLIIITIGTVSLLAVALLVVDILRLGELVHPKPTWQEYVEPMTRLLWSSILALIATVISIVSGIWIVRGFYLQKTLKASVDRLSIAFYFPHFIVALYVLALANSIYEWMDFYHPTFGFLEILLAYWLKEVPFVVFYLTVTYTSLNLQSRQLIHLFGGTKWQQFVHVEWVAIRGQVLELFLILFAFIITAYEVPALIGSSVYPLFGPTIFEYYYSIDLAQRFMIDVLLFGVAMTLVVSTIALLAWTSRTRQAYGKGRQTL